jgi:hypothetical protein
MILFAAFYVLTYSTVSSLNASTLLRPYLDLATRTNSQLLLGNSKADVPNTLTIASISPFFNVVGNTHAVPVMGNT